MECSECSPVAHCESGDPSFSLFFGVDGSFGVRRVEEVVLTVGGLRRFRSLWMESLELLLEVVFGPDETVGIVVLG